MKFIKSRKLEGVYENEIIPTLRKGIIKGKEEGDFINFIKSKSRYGITSQDIKELIDEKYFDVQSYSVDGHGTFVLIHLGPKGRKLTKGSYLDRLVYFLEYAREDTPGLFTFLFGGLTFLILFRLFSEFINLVISNQVDKFINH